MSGHTTNEPLHGVIVQGDRVVGHVNLTQDSDRFIADFNRQYAALTLRAVKLDEIDSL